MKRLKGASNQKELSSFFESSSRVFHRRRVNDYLPENDSSKPIVRSYNRSRVPRLRWTYELHQCFVNAVQELGGATPKRILPMMNVKGVTLSHIKSHLQEHEERSSDSPSPRVEDKRTRTADILHRAHDYTENVGEPVVTSLSSSTVVDIELTLGGPYAS
ncbi:hypothetical protein L1987_05308 [Smallanthus sonchifolius]|uniref:Uncharacterized protein n=1 Tax=Smallanthus sonchifolius TaxID=185202 RepID=A0ACB9JVA8_9ASTR|nr:hypothetical protein L1987_05308 [Smallanthus sonchifolius]